MAQHQENCSSVCKYRAITVTVTRATTQAASEDPLARVFTCLYRLVCLDCLSVSLAASFSYLSRLNVA